MRTLVNIGEVAAGKHRGEDVLRVGISAAPAATFVELKHKERVA